MLRRDYLVRRGGTEGLEGAIMGLTTIYPTLDILANLGLLYKFDFGDVRARYELAQGPKGIKHHQHLICTSCNRAVDYAVDYTDFIDEEIGFLQETEKGLSNKVQFQNYRLSCSVLWLM